MAGRLGFGSTTTMIITNTSTKDLLIVVATDSIFVRIEAVTKKFLELSGEYMDLASTTMM
ncbi:hypothetical protein HYC85_004911 [Camellia sinensis]|uniref:Uncharacterized protein n=1 Tax=Camellia sinensis TaxID=4442 RepID=A0A7J7HZT5_CAMSI|nr:hypothetical protein HYC85_004911 [Camellia sinensis]